SVSRCFTRLGSVTLNRLKGLEPINLSFSAHPNTVRAAASHTPLTVRAPRTVVTSWRDHALASSSVIPFALPKRRSRSRKTTRHLSTLDGARCVAFTHASNSCHGLNSLAGRAILCPSNFGNSDGRVSGL